MPFSTPTAQAERQTHAAFCEWANCSRLGSLGDQSTIGDGIVAKDRERERPPAV